MLQLFGSGLIAWGLELAGIHAKLPDSSQLMASQSQPGLVLVPDPNPSGLRTVEQYLKELEALGLVGASQGVWVQSGPVLLANHQGTVPLSAASLTKIATSLAALKTWGPDYQFETLISATGPVHNGVLHGNLVIQGSGDPFFVWEEAIALGNSLNRLGISSVTGNLIIAGKFAMNYKSNSAQAGELLKLGLNAQIWPKEAKAQFLKNSLLFAQKPQVKIAGSVLVAANNYLPLHKHILLLRHRSLPLSQILKEMNVYSNNEMAQMLAQLLGGARVVQSLAASAAAVPPSEIQLVNGSGLGAENRISPRAVCAMLVAIQQELFSHQLSLADLFPVAGRDRRGTMQTRNIPLTTVVKTGTLQDVSALAGVMPTRDRGLVWFAIFNQGSSDVEGFRSRQDQLLQRLIQQWRPASTLPAALTPQLFRHTTTQLGAAERNEIMYRGQETGDRRQEIEPRT